MPPKLVIFDCDGVLVDTEGLVNTVLSELLSQYGPVVTPRECIDQFTGGTMAAVGESARASGYAIPKSWPAEVYEAMFARLEQGVEVIPGVVELLDRLDLAGIPYCVGSNGPMEKMEITLVQTGLMDRLRGRIYSPHIIGLEHAKPAAGLYLHATRTMGFDPSDCVVIEDSANGALGAKNAGIRCFGYTRDTAAEVLKSVDAIPFGDMAELPGLLGLDKG